MRRPSAQVRTQDVSVEKYLDISYEVQNNINRFLESVSHTVKDVKEGGKGGL